MALSLTTNVFGQLKIDSASKMQRQGRLKNIRDKNTTNDFAFFNKLEIEEQHKIINGSYLTFFR